MNYEFHIFIFATQAPHDRFAWPYIECILNIDLNLPFGYDDILIIDGIKFMPLMTKSERIIENFGKINQKIYSKVNITPTFNELNLGIVIHQWDTNKSFIQFTIAEVAEDKNKMDYLVKVIEQHLGLKFDKYILHGR